MARTKVLPNQTTLELFKPKPQPKPRPTWDDVQKGRAELVDVIEPCEGEGCMFWRGECTHVKGSYAFPKKRPNGMCLAHRIVWKENE